jgi:IS5 family transposase
VTHYQVCEQRPADSTLLTGSLQQHVEQFGRAPERVAADPGFFSAANESKAEQMGVKRVSIPSHDTKSPARKQRQKQRWFKELQKWRTGCEGASAFSNAGTDCGGRCPEDRPAFGAGSDWV